MKLVLWIFIGCLIQADALAANSSASEQTNALNEICEHFQKNRVAESFSEKVLCFEGCKENEVNASQFWGKLENPEENDIHDALIEYDYKGFNTAFVTEVDMNGDGIKEIRISSVVGTANCRRDLYLMPALNGFKLIQSPTLDVFSGEGGYCGAGDIFFSTYNGRSYAVNTYYGKITAYKVNKDFDLVKVCSVPKQHF